MYSSSVASSSSCSSQRTVLFSRLTNPNPLRFTTSVSIKQTSFQRRYRIVCCSPTPSLVEAMSPVVIVPAAVAAGYLLVARFGGSRNACILGAVALASAAYALNLCVAEVAARKLHGYMAASDDPSSLKTEDVEAILNMYGVSKQNEAIKAELRYWYRRFVYATLPPRGERLEGNEVEKIIKFKNSLGIDNPDAAALHMEIGRHIYREMLENIHPPTVIEHSRAFQKLIYVSTLMFGEASTFLLPWKRVFKVTDAQVEDAIRDNAPSMYAFKLESIGRDLDVEQLISLREAQLLYRLSDNAAEKMFRWHAEELVEENIWAALSMLMSTAEVEASDVIEEIDKILVFNDLLISLNNHPDASRFARGVGSICLFGQGDDWKMDKLKQLFRVYVRYALSGGQVEHNKLAALGQLRNIFGLGKEEAESIILDVTSRVYYKQVAQAVSLAATSRKAKFLRNLCDKLHFDPQKAIEIHEEIYRNKLLEAVSTGEISTEDVKSLELLEIMLCIPQETVEAAYADICGRPLKENLLARSVVQLLSLL